MLPLLCQQRQALVAAGTNTALAANLAGALTAAGDVPQGAEKDSAAVAAAAGFASEVRTDGRCPFAEGKGSSCRPRHPARPDGPQLFGFLRGQSDPGRGAQHTARRLARCRLAPEPRRGPRMNVPPWAAVRPPLGRTAQVLETQGAIASLVKLVSGLDFRSKVKGTQALRMLALYGDTRVSAPRATPRGET